ncbi:MAG: HD domain-containing protein [Eubacterium sp.]|nr:HD domain-containing protein [Eubacterium sp.]
MNYTEVLNYITEKNKLGSMPGISAIMELLKRLGSPEKSVKALHIAGTNGKGSIMAYVEQTLILRNLKVGRYISPAIFDYRERWQINKKYIEKDRCAALITRIAGVVEDMIADGFRSPTSFEIETALAFLYFAEERCDYMLIECGMGGKGDATNVIESAVIDVLASISLDHMQFLGDTPEVICSEKLGIVRPGGRLISYPQMESVRAVIEKDSTERGYEVTYPDEDSLQIIKRDIAGSEFRYKGVDYKINLSGDYQVLNACTAIEVLNRLSTVPESEGGIPLSKDDIREGLMKTEWQGRMTIVSREPLFVVDGAHNRDAWVRLADTLSKCFTKRKFIFIMGVLADKEYTRMMDSLCPYMKKAVTVTTVSPRALDGKKLLTEAEKRGVEGHYAESCKDAVKYALSVAEETDVIIACGTLTFAGEIINIMKSERHNLILKDKVFLERLDRIEEAEKSRRFCRHGLEHLVSVARIGALIALDEELDIERDVIYAAALLHDIGRCSEYTEEGKMSHAEAGVIIAEDILRRVGYSDSEIEAILLAVKNHGEDTAEDGTLAKILFKADKLSRNCFRCEAEPDCFWEESLKNKELDY